MHQTLISPQLIRTTSEEAAAAAQKKSSVARRIMFQVEVIIYYYELDDGLQHLNVRLCLCVGSVSENEYHFRTSVRNDCESISTNSAVLHPLIDCFM